MKLIRYLLGLSLFLLAGQWVKADETAAESFNPQKSIFEHLGENTDGMSGICISRYRDCQG